MKATRLCMKLKKNLLQIKNKSLMMMKKNQEVKLHNERKKSTDT
jgi:hypothetical protein